jgi:hypothetical protein
VTRSRLLKLPLTPKSLKRPCMRLLSAACPIVPCGFAPNRT